jgi:hypothetical protein
MKTMVDPVALLQECGWTMVRRKKHPLWRCPCGKHNVTIPGDLSFRTAKNAVHDILRCGCESVDAFRRQEKPEAPSGKCFVCGAELSPVTYKRDWIEHDGLDVCLRHRGVKAWNRSFRGEAETKDAEV